MTHRPAQILIATRNGGKLREIEALLDGAGVRLLSLQEFPDIPPVEETGDSFAANAALKAVKVAERTGLWTLADDSGLEVEALGGEPGVFSARYAGPRADDAANLAKLLSRMRGVLNRRATFRCVMALAEPGGKTRLAEGRCPGRLIHEPRGTSGFGYDPIFVPEGYELTFAELPADIKNRISHRARAMAPVKAWLQGTEWD